jgi:hypothetical protein
MGPHEISTEDLMAIHRVAQQQIHRLDRLAGVLVVLSRVLLAALALLVAISSVRR